MNVQDVTSDEDSSEPSKMSKRQLRNMEQGLQNPLILYKILQDLSFLELKACRVVNSKWKAFSSEILLKRNCCKIGFKLDTLKNAFHLYRGKKMYMENDLAALNKMLAKQDSNLPCNHFGFVGTSLNGEDVDRFFKIQGEKIKTLELKRTKTSIDGILKTLPNVENLILSCVESSWEQDQKPYLPSLKSLSFKKGGETATHVMNHCSSLTVVRLPNNKYDHYASDTLLIINSKKVHLLSQFCCYYSTSPYILHDFSSAHPKLRKLEFGDKKHVEQPDHKTKLSEEFSRLLESTKETLEYLGLGNLCARYEMQIPPLCKLKTLALGYFDSRCEKCLPANIDLKATFPNLSTLNCEYLHCDEDDDYESYFPPNSMYGTFSTVENLEIRDHCTDLWMTRLYKLCPNFKNLTIHSTIWLEEILEKTFRLWQHLEIIQVVKTGHVNYLYPGEYFVPNLDHVITGCSNGEGGYENVKIKPFICDMKKLKHFFINFKPDDPEPKRERFEPVPITHISGVNGFQLLPGLKVTIGYDYNCDSAPGLTPSGPFELVAPYVNFRHKCYTKSFWSE